MSSSSDLLLLLVLVVLSAAFLETDATSRECVLVWQGCAELWWGGAQQQMRQRAATGANMHAADHRRADS